MEPTGLEERLNQWLAERGVEGRRRVVRTGSPTTLVSKFETGFAQDLIARLEALPGLFDAAAIQARYEALATVEPTVTRAATWHRAAIEHLTSEAKALSLGAREIAEVVAGIDSVAALLDSVLFTGPSAGDSSPASDAEAGAYAEVLERMDADSGLFTRSYGTFEGSAVVNHCPGSRFARLLFLQAWQICSGRA